MSPHRTLSGGCHCQAVLFEVRTPVPASLLDCDCSICQASGYLHLIRPEGDFRLLRGEDRLTEYRFNTMQARHLFCSVCGVKSFYRPRSHPDGVSVNYRCLHRNGEDIPVTIKAFSGSRWEENVAALRSQSEA